MPYEAKVTLQHWLGDIVFLRVSPERQPGMVTGIWIGIGEARYEVTWGHDLSSVHYSMELASEYIPEDWPHEGDEEEEDA